ncbi:MAG: dihydroxyacetone kinase subunit L [Acidobacteriia bacterium]|nr:dihydroxyacetone kinase subunit L [Terriglobia bacterium]
MPKLNITPPDLRRILCFVAEAIGKEEAYLNSLDGAIGDGDHGITMRVGFEAVKAKVGALDASVTIDGVLTESGAAFMGATGGAIGVLLGRMLMSAGAALQGCKEIGTSELRVLLNSMETAVASAGKAKPGDKTILDAVHAANQAVATTAEADQSLPNMLSRASLAAGTAAQNTAGMRARVGRASRLGDRVLGHPDPGAVSFSIIMRAMAQWLEEN